MKKLPLFTLLSILALGLLYSCKSSNSQEELINAYESWYNKNNDWLAEQQARTGEDGKPYYTTLIPDWNPNAFVLIHYLNDRKLTEGNLSPLYTSTIDTRYHVSYYEGTPLDSSYTQTKWGPGIFRTKVSGVITGWAIAMEDMRVGDSAEVVIPYQQAYGANATSNVMPYSNLKFLIKLVDIVDYEKNPK